MVLLVLLVDALVEDVATRRVGALILTVLLEDEGSALRADSVELLLLRDEVHLRLWLHSKAHL